jgi:hypothetical protein
MKESDAGFCSRQAVAVTGAVEKPIALVGESDAVRRHRTHREVFTTLSSRVAKVALRILTRDFAVVVRRALIRAILHRDWRRAASAAAGNTARTAA